MTDMVKRTHESMGAEAGGVLVPSVYPFQDDRLQGFSQLFPVYQGKGAARGIAELSFLSAAGMADEVRSLGYTVTLVA